MTNTCAALAKTRRCSQRAKRRLRPVRFSTYVLWKYGTSRAPVHRAVRYPASRKASLGNTTTTLVQRCLRTRYRQRATSSGNCSQRHQRAPRRPGGQPAVTYAGWAHSWRQATAGRPQARSPATTISARENCFARFPTTTADPDVSGGIVQERSSIRSGMRRGDPDPRAPGSHRFLEDVVERLGEVPGRIVRPHLREVRDVADVVALAVLVDVVVLHRLTGEVLHPLERLENGAGIGPAPAEVVDLPGARVLDERLDEPGDIVRVDVVPHLFAFVAEHVVAAAAEVHLDQVVQEPVQLHARVIRACEAAATQAARVHAEVPAVLLHHDVGRDL